jgi:hypothetical protein
MSIDAVHGAGRPHIGPAAALAALLALGGIAPSLAAAQTTAHAAEAPRARPTASVLEANAMRHMEMSPTLAGTAADSARAARIAMTLRAALVKYRDTTAAVTDGYRMFMPKVKDQKVYHFTNSWRAVQEGFRFDPSRPTSLLYTRGADGRFALLGAMYTAPRRFGPEQLDARVPLSVAHWHKHVNWCLPKRSAAARWQERRDGQPVFGPESPIDTKAACDAVGGVFRPSLFGWMVHANVFAGNDPAAVWGDDHMRHDAHAMMGMDPI